MHALDNNLLNLAARFYVRFRRLSGRIIDATWLTQDKAYAHEVMRLARRIDDEELARLCDRFEDMMFGVRPRSAKVVSAEMAASPEPPVAFRYVGALR